MNIKVETEKKYYCMEPEELVNTAELLNFKLISEKDEIDEYFTDIDSEFIKNRTCLRIRRKNNESMEITFKDKSTVFLGHFCKLENNISADINEYNNYVELFTSLGFYSYVEIYKNRTIYQLKNDDITYSIMLDKIYDVGGFVEFEIISDKDKYDRKELNNELNKFVSLFKQLKLKEADEPYRDIVAKNVYSKLYNKKNVKNICICLDSEISKYEKDFFKKYKNKISNIVGNNVKWGIYKHDTTIETKIEDLIVEYLDNLIYDGKDLFVTIKLLDKLLINKYFITKVNKTFVKVLFTKFNIKYHNVLYLENNNLKNQLLKNNININETILMNDRLLRTINSNLLIIINNDEHIVI